MRLLVGMEQEIVEVYTTFEAVNQESIESDFALIRRVWFVTLLTED
jgi:hypothetical protein